MVIYGDSSYQKLKGATMSYLSRNVTGIALSIALTMCFAAGLSADARKNHLSSKHLSSKHQSRKHCSIGCSQCSSSSSSSNLCKKVCKSHSPVREGCIFVPERTETVIDPSTCLPISEIVPGANLYYREQGRCYHGKPTIIFVPPLAGTSDVWHCQQAELSKCYRTIAVDLRGTGRSDVTDPSTIQYTHQLFANDIHAMLQDPTLDVDKNIIFVGNAMGGSIGIVYATTYPGEVAKLVMINSGPGLYLVNNCAVSPTCDPSFACTAPNSCCDLNGCVPICWPFPIFTATSLSNEQTITSCTIESCLASPGGDPDICIPQSISNFYAWDVPLTIFNEACQPALANVQAQTVQALTQVSLDGVLSNILTNAWTQDLRPLLRHVDVPTLICIGSIDERVPNGAGLFSITTSGTLSLPNLKAKAMSLKRPLISSLTKY